MATTERQFAVEVKSHLGALISAVFESARSTGTKLQRLRSTAIYDNQKDQFITSLSQFSTVEAGIRGLKQVREKFGIDQSHRIALQLVYEYFARTNRVRMSRTLLDKLWQDFVAELDTVVWVIQAVTNLPNFQCKEY